MPDQTLKNGAPRDTATVADVTGHAGSLAHDLITLAELQARLLYYDAREVGSRSAGSAVSLAAMLALALSSIPVVLLGIGEMLAEWMDWPRGAANLLVGGIAGLAGTVAGWISFRRLRRVTTVFSRTQQELHENLEFVKSLVGGTGPRRKQEN
jgi:hypothetical protein